MSVRQIVNFQNNNDILKRKSQKIKGIDEYTMSLITDMKDTLLERGGAGLAAVQIGIHKRVIVVKLSTTDNDEEAEISLDQFKAFLNPFIIKEGKYTKGFDGCLSIPGFRTWDTLRPETLTFRAQDEQGKNITLSVEGFNARLIHHEIDHLNGKLYFSRLAPDGKLYSVRKTESKDEYSLLPPEIVKALINGA